MALESGFFNSVNNDRLYNARDISRYFENILSSGVFKRIANCCKVSPASGMVLSVAPGAGLIDSQWFRSTTAETVEIPAANAVLPRIDNVVARLDLSDEVRAISLHVVSGSPAEPPSAPDPIRTTSMYDLVLAHVYVPAGASRITADNVTDTRENDDICGYVHSLVDTPIIKTHAARFVVANDDTRIIPVNIVGLNAADLLNVYVNGFKLAPGVEYTLSGSFDSITLVEAVEEGTIVDFEAYRPTMPDDIPDLADTVTDMAQAMTTMQATVSTLEEAVSALSVDTGWINLAWESGISSNDNWAPRIRRVGKSIFLRGLCTGATTIDQRLLTIPEEYWPKLGGHAYVGYASFNNNTRAARMFIDESGAVIIRSTEGGAPESRDNITISTSWLVD